MTNPRDPDADDLFLDHCLDEQLGGTTPPDLQPRVGPADSWRMARAAAAVDAAAEAAAHPVEATGVPRWLTVIAGLLVVAGLTFGWTRITRLGPSQDPVEQAAALLDEFHRVMPRQPESLRDPEQRRQLAPHALPVLDRMIHHLREHPTVSFAARVEEFTIYAAVLGDPIVQKRLHDDAAAGAATARCLQLAVRIIASGEAAARHEALATLGQLLADPNPAAPRSTVASVVTCLVTAGDLSEPEARQLAAGAHDPEFTTNLELAASMAATSSRRLLGKPLELVGRLESGTEFTTTTLRGKVVLVCFWASWCQPCLAALPEVVAAHQRYAAAGLAVVGVSCDWNRAALTSYLAAHPAMAWPQFFEPSRAGWHELAFWCGVRTIPTMFLIDKRGVLRSVDARDGLDGLVQRLLAE